MLGFLKSAGRASAVAVGVTVAAAVWYVFSSVAPPTPATLQTAVTKPVEQTAPNSAEKLSADSPDAIAQKVASAPMTDAASVATPARSASGAVVDAKAEAGGPDATGSLSPSQRPEFDLVRVEPSGDSVIAGRGTPGATIALVDGDAVLGRAAADARGEVVFPCRPGSLLANMS